MSEATPSRRRGAISLRTARMEAFSDGVFSIAITLLVLDLVVPAVTDQQIGRHLLDQWPVYLAYVVSFVTIGNAWLNHSVITEYLDHADSILLRLNLLLLFFVSLLPFPTRMLASYLSSVDGERIAVTCYGLSLLTIAAATSLVWHYALRERLVSRDNSDDDVRALTAKLNPGLVSYAAVIGIGLLFPKAAVVLYLVIALLMAIPFREALRKVRRREHT